MFGYTGKILRVNLSKRDCRIEELEHEVARQFLGGQGFGVRYIYKEVAPDCDPLGPENKIIFAAGPLTDTGYPSGGRYDVCFKSPLTNMLCDSSSGGFCWL